MWKYNFLMLIIEAFLDTGNCYWSDLHIYVVINFCWGNCFHSSLRARYEYMAWLKPRYTSRVRSKKMPDVLSLAWICRGLNLTWELAMYVRSITVKLTSCQVSWQTSLVKIIKKVRFASSWQASLCFEFWSPASYTRWNRYWGIRRCHFTTKLYSASSK